MPTYLYYTQGISDFQEETATCSEERLEIHLKRKKHRCPKCKSKNVTLRALYERRGREGRGERFSVENLLRDHSSHDPREGRLAENKKAPSVGHMALVYERMVEEKSDK